MPITDPCRNIIIVTDEDPPRYLKLTPDQWGSLHPLTPPEEGAIRALDEYGCLLASVPEIPGIGAVCIMVNVKKLLQG